MKQSHKFHYYVCFLCQRSLEGKGRMIETCRVLLALEIECCCNSSFAFCLFFSATVRLCLRYLDLSGELEAMPYLN